MGEVIWGVDFVGNKPRREADADPVTQPVVRLEQFMDPNAPFVFISAGGIQTIEFKS